MIPHLAQDEPASKQPRMKSFPVAAAQHPQGPPVAFSPGQPAQSAQPPAQPAQPDPYVAQFDQERKRPKIVDTVTDFHDIDWGFPLHEQLYWNTVLPAQSGYIDVINETWYTRQA